jgi:hypothetical protein
MRYIRDDMISLPRWMASRRAVFIAALAVFCLRGPFRAITDCSDFATVYSASRCWLAHTNPYLQSEVFSQYYWAHGDRIHAPNAQTSASVYAPSIFPLTSITAPLNWTGAKWLWVTILCAAFAASLIRFSRPEIIPDRKAAFVLVILFLIFSPVHTGITKGQPSVICIALIVCALCQGRSSREDVFAGLLLGVSCCIKPNIALPYLVFCGWRRQWLTIAVSVAVAAVITSVGLAVLAPYSPDWLSSWLNELKSSSVAGGSMDPTIASPMSHLLINFQTITGFFSVDQALCNAITYLLLGGLAAYVLAVTRATVDPWLALALLSILVLLSSYHRYYDLQLLMLCAPAGLRLWQEMRRKTPRLLAAVAVSAAALWFPIHAIAVKVVPPPEAGAQADVPMLFLQFITLRNEPLCLVILAALFTWAILKDNPSHSRAAVLNTTVTGVA